ncbi:hypothetical protein M378DRAFT_805558 [Amanita muscaria Koide BX008]|uniref:Uncharacterized protein n=1 Tax=Amanita muscaria (strain Koide BX008) TaxID=946122 RepID=A0A0C2X0B7_AMAMK|nr:hypothetical protein M378DRAFT_805558 [Amanita muscaria Koide BX008]
MKIERKRKNPWWYTSHVLRRHGVLASDFCDLISKDGLMSIESCISFFHLFIDTIVRVDRVRAVPGLPEHARSGGEVIHVGAHDGLFASGGILLSSSQNPQFGIFRSKGGRGAVGGGCGSTTKRFTLSQKKK